MMRRFPASDYSVKGRCNCCHHLPRQHPNSPVKCGVKYCGCLAYAHDDKYYLKDLKIARDEANA